MVYSELIPFYPEWNFDWFILINSTWSNSVFDFLLPLLRHKLTWIPLYLFIAGFLLKNHRTDGLWAILFCLASFGISNTLSAEVLKPVFKQERPCNDPNFNEQVQLRVKCGGGKSFPSAHATNHFALSFYLIIILARKYKWVIAPLIFWAALVSYAQVYVGVHYPVDVMAGALLGVLIGVLVGSVFNKVVKL